MSNPVRQAQYQSPKVGDPGGSIGPISPGWLIRGYAVDNLSGSWLYNPATGQWIAPYTLGFTSALRPAVLSLLVQYAAVGPGRQASSTLGTPFSVTMYDSPILNNPGTAFLNPDGTALTAVSIFTNIPQYIQSATAQTGLTLTLTPSLPIQPGDFLIIQVCSDAHPTLPTGFTSLFSTSFASASTTYIDAYTKIAGNSEPPSYSVVGASANKSAILTVYRKVNGLWGAPVANISFA